MSNSEGHLPKRVLLLLLYVWQGRFAMHDVTYLPNDDDLPDRVGESSLQSATLATVNTTRHVLIMS